MATATQDQRWNDADGSAIVVTFFDSHTPPRPAKIDTSDRQPVVAVSDGTVLIAGAVTVAPDNMSVKINMDVGSVGSGTFTVDSDVNLASGQDTSLLLTSEVITVTPGAAGQAASGAIAIPPASAIPPTP